MEKAQRLACIFILSDLRQINQGSKSSEKIRSLVDACRRFTPQIALRGEQVIFLEVGKSLHLFSEASLEKRIQILAKKMELQIQIIFSDSVGLGLSQLYFPRFHQSRNFSDLPIEGLVVFDQPFSQDSDSVQQMKPDLDQLKALGVVSVADFLKIPRKELGSRFGERLVRVSRMITGEFPLVWPEISVSTQVKEEVHLDDLSSGGSETQLDWIFFPLKTIIDRALIRLKGLSKRASRVRVEFEVASWSSVQNTHREFDFILPVPQGSSVGLLPLIREKILGDLSREPLLAPLSVLRFEVLETTPARSIQQDFFHSQEIEEEARDQLLGRLLGRFGESHVFYAQPLKEYCPEKSWQRVLSPPTLNSLSSCPSLVSSSHLSHKEGYLEIHKAAQSSLLESMASGLFFEMRTRRRPSRLLSPPQRLTLQPGVLSLNRGKCWRVRSWRGPERILTHWWDVSSQSQVKRDYFEVSTEDHEILWVFFDRSTSPTTAYLHGFFD